jgi:hypothetical protein
LPVNCFKSRIYFLREQEERFFCDPLEGALDENKMQYLLISI